MCDQVMGGEAMVSVWVLVGNDEAEIGYFSSREAAEAAVHPSIRGTDAYEVYESVVDEDLKGAQYGPVYDATVDLETGETLDDDRKPTYKLRTEAEQDRSWVAVRRHGSIAKGYSAVSYEAALTNACGAREEHIASGKPTREPVEEVWLEGVVPGIQGRYAKPTKIMPGQSQVLVPYVKPEAARAIWTEENEPHAWPLAFGQLVFTRTDRRTASGLPIFELVTEDE